MMHFKDFLKDKAVAVGLRPEPIQAIIDEETKYFRDTVSVTDRRTNAHAGVSDQKRPNGRHQVKPIRWVVR